MASAAPAADKKTEAPSDDESCDVIMEATGGVVLVSEALGDTSRSACAAAVVAGACARCCLRLCHAKHMSLFLKTTAELDKELVDHVRGQDGVDAAAVESALSLMRASTGGTPTVCTCCLGILQTELQHPSMLVPDAKTKPSATPGGEEDGGGAGAGAGAGAGGAVAGAGCSIARSGASVPAATSAGSATGDDSTADVARSTSMQAAQQVLARLSARNYDVEEYELQLSVPTSVWIRSYSMWHHLHKEFPDAVGSFRRVLDVKTVLKECLRRAIHLVYPDSVLKQVAELGIEIVFRHSTADFEAATFLGTTLVTAKPRKRKRNATAQNTFSNSSGVSFKAVSRAIFFGKAMPEHVPCPPKATPEITSLDVNVLRQSIFLKGRYCKFVRGVSQTRWSLTDTTRMGRTSVHEEIARGIDAAFGAHVTKFHSAGREDIDVRMLGSGRPFVLELVDAARTFQSVGTDRLKELEAMVNSASEFVQVSNLSSASKAEFESLQRGAESKRKKYVAVVWVSKHISPSDLRVLDNVKDLKVEQLTPVRVVHRRSLLKRDKMVHSINTEFLNPHFFLLRLETSAGTYVKEFVHGDLGRTSPNVGELLGCDADILQLDVEDLILPNDASKAIPDPYA